MKIKIKDIISFYNEIESNSLKEDNLNSDVLNITDNSKQVNKNSIFVAVIGEKFNGVDFVDNAIQNGALLVVIPKQYQNIINKKNVVFVENTRDFLSRATFFLYKDDIPQNILTVSGTNGKSSVSFFVSQILNHLNIKNMVIGTLGIYIDGKKELDCLTTPSPSVLCEYFKIASKKGISYVVMESSSHGIEQHRMDGLNFKTLGFTNLSQDHLDYHKTMDNYFLSKSRLYTDFDNGNAVINVDDNWGLKLNNLCVSLGKSVLSYGMNSSNGLKILSITKYSTLQEIKIIYDNKEYDIEINLIGEFQVYNILCAMGMLLSCGFDIDSLVVISPKIKEVEGRLNLLIPKNNVNYKIFVDFAHTPNALEEVLKTLKKEQHNKLHVLFGCGGNRDKSKRAIMGKISSIYADVVYITDDNPRYEDPADIRFEIEKGVELRDGLEVYNIDGRSEAIKTAISSLNSGDILLVAGKGHESYQIIGDTTIHFSDKEEILAMLE